MNICEKEYTSMIVEKFNCLSIYKKCDVVEYEGEYFIAKVDGAKSSPVLAENGDMWRGAYSSMSGAFVKALFECHECCSEEVLPTIFEGGIITEQVVDPETGQLTVKFSDHTVDTTVTYVFEQTNPVDGDGIIEFTAIPSDGGANQFITLPEPTIDTDTNNDWTASALSPSGILTYTGTDGEGSSISMPPVDLNALISPALLAGTGITLDVDPNTGGITVNSTVVDTTIPDTFVKFSSTQTTDPDTGVVTTVQTVTPADGSPDVVTTIVSAVSSPDNNYYWKVASVTGPDASGVTTTVFDLVDGNNGDAVVTAGVHTHKTSVRKATQQEVCDSSNNSFWLTALTHADSHAVYAAPSRPASANTSLVNQAYTDLTNFTITGCSGRHWVGGYARSNYVMPATSNQDPTIHGFQTAGQITRNGVANVPFPAHVVSTDVQDNGAQSQNIGVSRMRTYATGDVIGLQMYVAASDPAVQPIMREIAQETHLTGFRIRG